MNYNTLLSKQAAKCLSADLRRHPEVIKLLDAVNNSYKCFEKDIFLSERAFRISEEEYSDINIKLTQQLDDKRKSIHELKETVYLVGKEAMGEKEDDLVAISTYLNQQLKKRKQTEKFLSTLISHLPKGILLEDSQRRILYSNQSFCNMFGITAMPEDLPGEDSRALLDQWLAVNFSEPEKFRLEIKTILENQEAETNHRLELANGRIYEQSYIPIYIEDEFLGHLWSYTDITERQRAHEKIVKSEQLLAQSQQIAKIGSWEMDLVLNRVSCTDEFFRLRSLIPCEDTVDFNLFLSVIHPNDQQTVYEAVLLARQYSQPFDITYRIVLPAGEIRILHDLGEVVLDKKGRPVKMRGTSQDITEQKKAQDEIANQRKFTEDILNNLPADVAVFDSKHNYLFLNPQAIKDAKTREWLIGKNDFDYCKWKGIDDSLAILRRAKFIEAVENEDNLSWTDEHITKDGEMVYILRKFHPYFENGVLKFVIGYGVDVSSLKTSEINLKKAFEVAEKTNKELEQFAFAASHDLQEPLRMVTNYLALIERKYKDVLDDTGKKYIHFAVDGALRMRQIILDLLEFSRIGRVDAKRDVVCLNELLNETLKVFSSQIQEKGALIHIGQLPVLNTFKVPLRQTFQNLIGNALKYQMMGNTPEITISAQEDKTHWEFSVKDNGIGIDKEHFEKIFCNFSKTAC